MRCFLNAPLLLVLLFTAVESQAVDAERFLVRDGQPRAEIVISKSPQRSTRLAAHEFQKYIAKISGATLPIVNAATDTPIKVYIGRSQFTDDLGIDSDKLKYGAYQIKSGDDYLVLIGDDQDFEPIEPWARNNGDRASGKLQREWEAATGLPYGVPNGGMYKNRMRLPGHIGNPTGAETGKNEQLEIWGFDERGSFNAVCGFLRQLGVRWYLPGELGEVVPQSKTIALPKIDEVVRPDFDVRRFNVRFGTVPEDVSLWAMHLGMRDPNGLQVAHGMDTMTHLDSILDVHPEWFALYGGKRDIKKGERLNHLCYSNEELFEAAVKWARAQFDLYDYETVSIMPPDAYIAICQCPLCEGKDEPDRGSRGKLSNHVWDFVNRVAKEVGKTNPDKKILCCAYGANTDPPTNIDQLEPNVQVVIVGGRRPRSNLPEQRLPIQELRAGWVEKTNNPLLIFENYPFTDRGWYLPAFTAKSFVESVNATKGISRGEDIWLSFGRDFATKDIGFNHFQVYFTARSYWGGPDQDWEAMLDEYCQLFYGPAGDAMKDFFVYCEQNWQSMEKEKSKVDQALAMFAAAQSKVPENSVFAKRLALIDDFLNALRSKGEQLGRIRGPVPRLRMVWDAEDIVIDGNLDDEYWQNCPTAATCSFRELQTGRLPTFGTSVKSGWGRSGDLYFAIRCDDLTGEPPNIATTNNEDQAMWYGDVVEILLQTDSHDYYQLAVNPAGALVDLDRGASRSDWFRWESQAEVATKQHEDHWTIEIRIPVTEDENDPLNQVVGRKPSASLPWGINLCRQRVREHGTEYSAFSPTGANTFHNVMKFAHFYSGRSQQFEAAEPDDDYLQQRKYIESLIGKREYQKAIDFVEHLLSNQKPSDVQKCDALGMAAMAACRLDDFERADDLAAMAAIRDVGKTIQMQNLATQKEYAQIVDQFGDEDLSTWPFWNRGEALYVRGQALSDQGQGTKADSDLRAALRFTPDSRIQLAIWRSIGHNAEINLKDPDAALNAYQQITSATSNNGSAEYYYGVLAAHRLLTEQKRYTDALKTLELVDTSKLRGFWKGAMLLARARSLIDSGKLDAARETLREILQDESASQQHKNNAEALLENTQ